MSVTTVFKTITNNRLAVFGLMLCLAFALYANVLRGDFVFDDNIFIENNQFVKEGNIKAIFMGGISQGSGLNDNFYRPLQQCLYALSYKLGGKETLYFHFWNVLFHGCNAFLVFWLLSLLFPNLRNVSFIVSLLFLLHPVQTQAISYISGLSEPLSAFFVLSSLIAYYHITNQKVVYQNLLLALAAVLIGVLALFAKENGVIVAPLSFLLLAYRYYSQKEPLNLFHKIVPVLLMVCGLSFVYVKLTLLNFTGNFGLSDQDNIYNDELWVRLFTFINIFTEYVRLLFVPLGLHYETPYTAYVNLSRPQAVLALLIIASWAVFGFLGFKKKDYIPAFSLLWFFMSVAPVSGIIPLNSMYLEHWLYMPSIGFLLLMVYWIDKAIGKYSSAWMLLIPVCVAYTSIVYARNSQWADAEKFYRNEIKFTKKSARMYNNLAMTLADRKHCDKAVEYYQKAIKLYDIYPQSHHNLGRCYEDLGMNVEAANEYINALMLDPNFQYSHAKLYNLLLKLNEKQRAENFALLNKKMNSGQRLTQEDIKQAVTLAGQ